MLAIYEVVCEDIMYTTCVVQPILTNYFSFYTYNKGMLIDGNARKQFFVLNTKTYRVD